MPATLVSLCYVCANAFAFHPEDVIHIKVDPRTNIPIDKNADGSPRSYTEDDVLNARQVVVCPPCVRDIINPARAARGLSPITVYPENPRPWEGQ